MISRCSGAMVSLTVMASSTVLVSTAKPLLTAAVAVSLLGLGSSASCFCTSTSTASIVPSSRHTRIGRASTSCSACASKSAATVAGSAEASAMTSTSEGPASMSIAHLPCTSDLAAVTHWFPGPTMMLAAGQPPTPCAMAAIACAPPSLSIPSALATNAAAFVTWSGWGLETHTFGTPASRAVMAVIMTLDGKGYRPPGA
mmetsp:Transcript_21898/g.44377  ORF Transcript_21898/g.44377 Transcript_21898/m.44377 type:complete len:200 (+) Transcript_21898:330-929(+)